MIDFAQLRAGEPVLAFYRFLDFELDPSRYELRRQGRNLRLEKIPQDLLILLVEKRGDLITREEIIESIWGKGVFVDSEAGINTAIRKIRQTLHDDPENPRFIQTVVGRGYRFLAPVTLVEESPTGLNEASTNTATSEHPVSGNVRSRKSWIIWAAASVLVVLVLALLGVNVRGSRDWLLGRSRPVAIHSLAVLPLENLSGDPAQDFFADGMTDELITNLAKVGSLRVISRTSVMRYKGTRKPLPEIARDLNVDAVVEGSVVHSGNGVRITAQLIYAPTDRHLWAEEYVRDQRDVLKLQREVARAIVQEIRATLTPEEKIRLGSTGAVDPKAYEAYLRGRSYWNQRTEAALGKAIEQFNAAIQTDPNYAGAYSGLADCYTTLGYFSYLDPNDVFPRAKAAADKALDLDPTLAEAHASLAYYNLYHAWDWAEAEKEFHQAIALNPNNATAHEWYSVFLLAMGRPNEAWTEINRAHELDPLSLVISTDVGFHYFYAREYDRAIAQLRSTIAINPNFPLAHLWLGRSYQQKKMYIEAIAELNQGNSGLPDWPLGVATIGNAYGEWGKKSDAQATLARLNELSRTKYVTPYGVALVYMGLGNKEEALTWFSKAVDGRSHWLVWLRLDPRLESLHSDPRFHELVHRVGFPE